MKGQNQIVADALNDIEMFLDGLDPKQRERVQMVLVSAVQRGVLLGINMLDNAQEETAVAGCNGNRGPSWKR